MHLTESTLYPLLKRLESAGLLTMYAVEHNGRLRKYYRITRAGCAIPRRVPEDWDDVVDIYEYVKRGANNEQDRVSDALRRALGKLPSYEVEQSIAFYAEMIDDRVEDGMSEADAVAALGPGQPSPLRSSPKRRPYRRPSRRRTPAAARSTSCCS